MQKIKVKVLSFGLLFIYVESLGAYVLVQISSLGYQDYHGDLKIGFVMAADQSFLHWPGTQLLARHGNH